MNDIRAITSTYHMLVKFPKVGSIRVLRGHQHKSCHLHGITTKQALDHTTSNYVQMIATGQSSQVEQLIYEKLTIPYVMVGRHRVNIVEVKNLDELDPRQASEEQRG